MILVLGLAHVTTVCCAYTLVTTTHYKYDNGQNIGDGKNSGNVTWKGRDGSSKSNGEMSMKNVNVGCLIAHRTTILDI